MNVLIRMLMGAAFLVLPAVAASAAAKSAADPRDLAGVWWTKTYRPNLEPVGGGALPFLADARAQYEKNQAGLKDGSVQDAFVKRCLQGGVVRTMAAPYPFEILQTQGLVTFMHEVNHVYRVVTLGGKHPKEDDVFPAFMGNEIGQWQGDTLIVDTTGYNGKIWLDAAGVPTTDQLHTVEHLRQIDGGRRLEDVITIDDPGTFAKPFDVRYVYEWRPDIMIREFTCGEPHRNLTQVTGAR